VDLARRAGVSRRLKEPRSALTGVRVAMVGGLLLLLFRLDVLDDSRLDSEHVQEYM